jgi:hypothetical protein
VVQNKSPVGLVLVVFSSAMQKNEEPHRNRKAVLSKTKLDLSDPELIKTLQKRRRVDRKPAASSTHKAFIDDTTNYSRCAGMTAVTSAGGSARDLFYGEFFDLFIYFLG